MVIWSHKLMTSLSKLVFFGNERLVSGLKSTDAPILRGLIERGYDIVAVVSSYSQGTSRNTRHLEVAEIAKEHNIPLLLPERPGDIEEELKALYADAAILAAYGRIVPQRIINVFSSIGIINVHPSLLPRHRGPTPIETTITAGDDEAGVSIMQLSAGMDEGPVYGQVRLSLAGTESKFDLYDKLSHAGATLLFDLLPDILSGALKPKPQKNTGVSYTTLLTKNDGKLDPLTDDAYACERKIRAYLSYPKTMLRINNNDVLVTSAKIAMTKSPDELVIECANNTLLQIDELVAPSGKKMSGAAYLRGYPT